MRNLAGVNICDGYIMEELQEAGIRMCRVDKGNTEVPYTIIGKIGPLVFTRSWYYWSVKGPVPYTITNKLYKEYKELAIRVDGDCTNPPPDTHFKPINYEEIVNSLINKHGWGKMNIAQKEYDKYVATIPNRDKYIMSYDIDSQQGLNIFAKELSKYYNK